MVPALTFRTKKGMQPDLNRCLALVDQQFDCAQLDSTVGIRCERLSIPLISFDPGHKSDCDRAAPRIERYLTSPGFSVRALQASRHPFVFSIIKPGCARKPGVLFYGYFDGQPVDPIGSWSEPPFDPAIKTPPSTAGEAVPPRGAADDNGQFMTFVESFRITIQSKASLPRPYIALIERDEKTGNRQHLDPWIDNLKTDIRADSTLFCDTGMPNSQSPAIMTRQRGGLFETLEIRAENRDLRSGLFGEAVQNPIHVPSGIISTARPLIGAIVIPDAIPGRTRAARG